MPLIYPKIRDDLIYREDPEREGYWYVKDPLRGEYFSFNEIQVEMMRALNGARSPEDLHEYLGEEFGVEIEPRKIQSFSKRLEGDYLLDISSYQVIDAKTRRAIRKLLDKRGLVFRAKPRDDRRQEGHLFSQGMEHIYHGDPAAAADYFAAVLEINPENERARQVLMTIQEGFLKTKAFQSTYKILFPVLKPDRFLEWLDRRIGRAFFSWFGLLLIVFSAVAMIYPIVEILSRIKVFERSADLSDAVAFFLLTFFFAVVHEVLGHGFACKHYGGSVRDAGAMLFFFVLPGAYSDTSDVYVFENRRHKVIVFLAGVTVWLIPLSMLWFLLLVLDPQVPGWNGMLAIGIWMLWETLVNLNPLIPFDGYYALASWRGKLNLRRESFAYLKRVLAEKVLGVKSDEPAPPPRDRRLYLRYAVLAGLFTIFIIYVLWITVFLPWIVKHLGTWGMILAVLWFVNVFGIKLGGHLVRLGKLVYRERRSIFTRRRSVVVGLAGGLVVAVLAMPWPFYVDGRMVLEPAQRAHIRAAEPGLLEEVRVEEGDYVVAGEVVAVLRSDDLELERSMAGYELEIARARLELLEAGATAEDVEVAMARTRAKEVASAIASARLRRERQLRSSEIASVAELSRAREAATLARGMRAVQEADADLVKAGSRIEEIEAARALVRHREALLSELDDRRKHLRLESPIAGVVVGENLSDRIGRRVSVGNELLEVHDVRKWRARIVPYRGEALSLLKQGQEVEMRAFAYPGEPLKTRVEEILPPEEAGGRPILETSLFDQEGLRSGMSGRARIYGPKRSVAYRIFAVPVIRIFDYELWRMLWG